MSVVRKFLFDTDFDDEGVATHPRRVEEPAPPPPPAEPEPPPPPTFSEAELQAARDQAFAAGRTAGTREAEAATGRKLAAAVQAAASGLQALEQQMRREAEERHREAIRVAMTVAARVLPEMAARNGMAEVEGLFRECMGFLLEEPRVTVRVADALAEAARERLEAVAGTSGFEGRLLVLGDAAMAVGDCRVEWAEGGAERNFARVWQDIETVLERALGHAVPGAEP